MNKMAYSLISAILTIAITGHVLANDTDQFNAHKAHAKQTFSAAGKRLDNQLDLQLATIKQNQQLGLNDALINRASLKTREAHMTEKKLAYSQQIAQLKPFDGNAVQNVNRPSFHHSFSIYSAYSQLIEDIDYDGFYQTFSITFDADIITHNPDEYAHVYAELYISENGGPWVHYFTTDNFTIYGESTEDEYEVYSTLNQGFPAGEYDILIDLYEVGFIDIVATYSAEEDPALYALPLESTDYDIIHTEIVVESHGHGGTVSYIALIPLLLLTLMRKR